MSDTFWINARMLAIYQSDLASNNAAVTDGVPACDMPEFRTSKAGSVFRFVTYIYDSLRNSRWVAVERDGSKRVETISIERWTAMQKPQRERHDDGGH